MSPAIAVLVYYRLMALVQRLAVVTALGQGASNQAIHSAAQEISIGIAPMRWKAQPGQCGVRGVGDVGECIEQCPVEVEKYGLEFYLRQSPTI